MRLWRRLGRPPKPRILRKENELYKFLDDIFKSFYLNEDIEYWYNKWSKIKNIKQNKTNLILKKLKSQIYFLN